MKFVVVVTALLIGSMLGLNKVLKDGSLLRYLDTHPHPTRVPPVIYHIGEGYYLMGRLEKSTTYFWRIFDRYPQSDYAEDAYFNYLRNLDDMRTPRVKMAELYQTYLDRYPEGKYTEIVQKRIEMCRTSR